MCAPRSRRALRVLVAAVSTLAAVLGTIPAMLASPASPARATTGSADVAGSALIAAGANTAPQEPVGGPLLGDRGVVVDDAPRVPKLPKVSASSYVIADLDRGAVLAAKDPHGRYRPASTLKVLTAITLLPRLERDTKVRPWRRAVAVDGSKVGITPKRRYRVEDLFNGLLMASGNDTALALAQAAGGLNRTLRLMNEKADKLHAYDTVAKTPHGLDRPGQRSSAYDLALLAQAGMRMPSFRDYVSRQRAPFPAPGGESFQIANHNDLLFEYEGAIGVKTGYTSKAGATYIGAARRDGHTILITMMHSKPDFWEDARALLDWGFAARGKVEPVGALVEPGPPPRHSDASGDVSGEVRPDDDVTAAGPSSAPKDRLVPTVLVGVLATIAVIGSATVLLGGRSGRSGRRRLNRSPGRNLRRRRLP